jgi:GT2 family glycosyltransferase
VDRGVGEIDKGQYDNKLDIIGACAGACMYKREMLEDVGLFDKNFFMYYEDAELSWRAHKQGWKGRFVPSAIVYHKRAGTTGKDKKRKREMTKLCLRNMITTVGRHGTIYQKFLFPIFLLIEAVKWIRRNNFAK